MLDMNVVIDTIKSGASMAQSSQNSLSDHFVQQMSNMTLSGSEAGGQVISESGNSTEAMMAKMNQTFASLKKDMEAHQAMQRSEVPADFSQPKNDLRDTVARGFPMENPNYASGKS